MAPPFRARTPFEGKGIGRRSLLAGAAAFGAFGAAGCSVAPPQGQVEGGDLLKRLQDRGVVRLGIANEKPYAYVNEDGTAVGEAPAIAKYIFEKLGVPETKAIPVDFSALIPGLKAQQFDTVAAGMYINPDRCEQVLFADPEYIMLDSFIVPKGNPKGIKSYKDIVDQGLKLATGEAYAEIDYALGNGVKDSQLLILPDPVAGLNAVETGRVAAFAGTNITVTNAVKRSDKAETTEPFQPYVDDDPQYGAGGFAFELSEKNLRDAFNRELLKLKQNDFAGLLKLVKPYGFGRAEMTDLTAKELCS
ncbi:ectoine/hydroxyectoine ABC transporter substrate-binding protein EhuB [Streptomyces sp. TR06-5]|uniref:ectoine/hydroxyectoine ABC transporter substrate-binding protein EhuB n=1 Tax=unclassified Streptomyces TaxID=2593676 RepID=UPI00399F492E